MSILFTARNTGLPAAQQQPRQLHIRRSQLRPPIHHHHNRVRLFQPNLRLPEDLRRNQRLIIRHHAARIDDPRLAPHPLNLAIDAVARNPRLIAHDRPPRSRQPVEQRALPTFGRPHTAISGSVASIRALGLSHHLRSQQLDLAPVFLV